MDHIWAIVDVEPTQLDWFTLRDAAGSLWRFVRRGPVSLGEPAHLRGVWKADRIGIEFVPGAGPSDAPARLVAD